MKKVDILCLLKDNRLRATSARAALLFSLRTVARPVSAEELHTKVPSIDLVTVYRTLQQFVRAGLVREFRFKDSKVRYEFFEGDHHHHLVCTGCGTVDELSGCGAQTLEKDVLRDSGRFATIEEHALEFFGTCKSCARS